MGQGGASQVQRVDPAAFAPAPGAADGAAGEAGFRQRGGQHAGVVLLHGQARFPSAQHDGPPRGAGSSGTGGCHGIQQEEVLGGRDPQPGLAAASLRFAMVSRLLDWWEAAASNVQRVIGALRDP